MTSEQTSFDRLIEALEKDYEQRNEGDVEYTIEIERIGSGVGVFVYDNGDKVYDGANRYAESSGLLAPSDSIPAAIALCCDRLREKVGK